MEEYQFLKILNIFSCCTVRKKNVSAIPVYSVSISYWDQSCLWFVLLTSLQQLYVHLVLTSKLTSSVINKSQADYMLLFLSHHSFSHIYNTTSSFLLQCSLFGTAPPFTLYTDKTNCVLQCYSISIAEWYFPATNWSQCTSREGILQKLVRKTKKYL